MGHAESPPGFVRGAGLSQPEGLLRVRAGPTPGAAIIIRPPSPLLLSVEQKPAGHGGLAAATQGRVEAQGAASQAHAADKKRISCCQPLAWWPLRLHAQPDGCIPSDGGWRR